MVFVSVFLFNFCSMNKGFAGMSRFGCWFKSFWGGQTLNQCTVCMFVFFVWGGHFRNAKPPNTFHNHSLVQVILSFQTFLIVIMMLFLGVSSMIGWRVLPLTWFFQCVFSRIVVLHLSLSVFFTTFLADPCAKQNTHVNWKHAKVQQMNNMQ